MQPVLNRDIPLDAILRWWYVLVALPAIGLVLSLVTNRHLFPPLRKAVTFFEGSPPITITSTRLIMHPGWKDDLLFAVLGLFLACGVIWLLEEIRDYRQRMSDP